MRRIILILGVLVLAVTASAQNNPYDIDDHCYELFLKAESLVGKEGFREAGDALLHDAVVRGDKKAQVMYYTCRLKNVIGTAIDVPKDASPEVVQEARDRKNQEVLAAHDDLKRMARSMDYMQYFYYSYSLTKNYFYNNKMQLQAVDLLKEMREIAIAEDNAYGKWYSAKEMASIYQVLRDSRTTRRYLSLLLKEYAETDDPTIKRQLIGSYYVDYAETFAPGSDSAKFYIDLAAMQESTVQDTVRYNLAYARYYAARGDRQRYKYYRDKCYDSPFADKIYSRSTQLMDCIDHMFEGKIDWNDVKKLPVRRLKVLEKQAEALGNVAVANRMKDLYIDDTEQFFARLNELHLEEMEARMGKARLEADLAEKSHIVEVTTVVISVLIIVIFMVVITALLHSISNLRRTNERVRQADEAKTRFVQNMSHEVRTPLNAIVGFSQLLSLPDGSFPPEEKEEFAGHIVNNTKMLTMLLDDILNASAMDKGNYKITYEEGECSFICHSSISSSEHRLQPGVKMLYVVPADARLTFRTDPQRVQQILINMLTNACKHTPSGEIRLGWTANGSNVDFFVEDTGPGVPADKAEAIFDRFTKLNDFVQGTGLGLSICREIADKMGGHVYLDTTYTSGARFILSLPLNPPRL
jgi:signal transduction histidine kinase